MTMKKNVRQGTLDALNKFYERDALKVSPKIAAVEKRGRNARPEKDVEKECLVWMRAQGWNVAIYESKAVWNSRAESWTKSGMKFGTCDCMGNTDDGVAVAVEFKAKGKLSTFNREDNHLQRQFIIEKINTNAFSCVVDSATLLAEIYAKWKSLREAGGPAAKAYLMLALPKAKTGLKSDRLFDDE